MQPSVQPGSDFCPRNRLDLTGIDLADTTLDLFGPRRFNTLIRFAVETLEKTAGKFCPVGLRQF